jgi:hypothetical protein
LEAIASYYFQRSCSVNLDASNITDLKGVFEAVGERTINTTAQFESALSRMPDVGDSSASTLKIDTRDEHTLGN